MFEGLVFWLVPVILLVVLILLCLQIVNHQRRPRLLVIEPLHLLVKSWRAVRFEPNNQGLRQLIKMLAATNLSKGTLLEQIIIAVAGSTELKSKMSRAEPLNQQSIGPLAEQYVVKIGTKKQSILIGPLEQIEGKIKDERINQFRKLARKSTENGYLSLVIASCFQHSDRTKSALHQIEGLVVLEPMIDELQRMKFRKTSSESARFLSVLPSGIAEHIFQQVFPNQNHFSLDAQELVAILPPKFAEADITRARVIGGADLIARHQALRVWQQQFDCVVVSRNPEDRDLPISPDSDLPTQFSKT